MGRKNIQEDFDLIGSDSKWLRCWYEDGVNHHTLSGVRWRNLKTRCRVDGSEQKRNPRYIGTENNFEDFQEFVNWSRSEIGYDLRELKGNFWAIDKDLLGGGKVYSPETSLFVPQAVNSFLVNSAGSRGQWPIGTYWDKEKEKFVAQITLPGKKVRHLRRWPSPELAHAAWQKEKIKIGRGLANEFKFSHLKLYNGLNLWLDRIQDDLDNSRESIFI